MSADKTAVRRELQDAWSDLESLVNGLSGREMEETGVIEGWSIKDLLGHIAFWAEKAAHDLKVVAEGRPDEVETPGSLQAVDEWNARESKRRAGMPVAAVQAEWRRNCDRARAALETLPESMLELEVKGRTVLQRFAGDTYEHYREHAEQIRAWQRQLETTEA